jgi:hypothetical protein
MDRILTVSDQQFKPDAWGMPGYNDRHIRNTLIDSGLVKEVYSFYYNEHRDPNTVLIEYCRKIKPQAIMLTLYSPSGPLTVNTFSIIKRESNIPIIMFWFDIHADAVIQTMFMYNNIVDLHMILGSAADSHIKIPYDIYYESYQRKPLTLVIG